ncbi:MAG: type II CAAX endopeptidase family protein [Anaerolineales bacterium]
MRPHRSLFVRIFLSPEEKRLRAGWRLLVQTILFFLFSTVLVAPAVLVFKNLRLPSTGMVNLVWEQIVELLSLTLSVYLARRYLDRRSFGSFGLPLDRNMPGDMLAGVLIAGVMMGVIFLLHLLFGWTKTVAYAWQSMPPSAVLGKLGFWLLIFLIVGWKEELWMRAYWLQNLADGLNVPWAVFLSSAVFGLLHLGNPNATWVSALGILLAGVFLALPWVWTRRLWLSIGLHLGWNFFEGAIFGFPVSGLDTFRLLQPVIRGPKLWTGGAFGPEAGLVVIPALLLGAALVWGYAQWTTDA